MPITVICSKCQTNHTAPDSFAGLACLCKCGNVVHVPALVPEVAPPRGSIFDELTNADVQRLTTPPAKKPTPEVETILNPIHGPSAAQLFANSVLAKTQRRSKSSSDSLRKIASGVLYALAALFCGFMFLRGLPNLLRKGELAYVAAAGSPDGTQSLDEARQGFQTRLVRQLAPPDPVPTPPRTVFRIVRYESSVGQLAAYLTPDPRDGEKHPAIIWITGGDCNSIGEVWEDAPPENDQTASAFRKAGIVMMFPSLRGGNNNPGSREFCLGEVDDVCAAAEFLVQQEFVDADRIYLGGHSTGGSLVLLTAASANKFRAVFSFGPVGNVGIYGTDYLPFDLQAARELELRAPIRWLHSIKGPTFVFEGAHWPGNPGSLQAMSRATKNQAIQFHLVRGANHFSILAPTTNLIAAKILNDTGPVTNLSFTENELQSLMSR